MTYTSLDELFTDKTEALEEIGATVRPLSAARLGFHPTPGAWSIAEIVEHLAIVETGLLRLLRTLTEKAEKQGNNHSPVHISLDERYRDSVNGKIKTRQQSEPTGNAAAADSLESLRGIQAGLVELRPRLDRVDLSSVSFNHPALGDLTLGQWLAFVMIHEERHLRQMRGVAASPSFPSA